MSIANDIITRADIATGEMVNYRETTTWFDGSPMTDAKKDGVVYRKSGNTYYKLAFSESLDLEFWGAIGNGIVDDSAALKKALDYAILTGTKLTSKKDRTYLVSSNIVLDTLNSKSGTVLDFNFASIKLVNANIIIRHNSGIPYLTTSLTTDMKKGDTFLNLTDVTGIEKGDLIEVESPAVTSNNVNVLQYYVVNDLDGNKVYVDGYVVNDINPQQIIDDGKTGNIVVRLRKMGKGLAIRNLKIQSDRNKEQTSLLIANQHQLLLEDITVDDATREGIYIQYSGLSTVNRFKGNRYGYVQYDQGYSSVPSSPGGLSFGYGLIVARCAITNINDSEGSYGWHAFDASRGATFVTYNNCKGFKNAFTYSTHEGAWDVRYLNCSSDGGPSLNSRCVFLTIQGGNFKANYGHAIAGFGVSETIIESVIIDNVYGAINKGTAVYTPSNPRGFGARSAGRNQQVIIKKNTFLNQSQNLTLAAEDIIFEDNTILNADGFSASIIVTPTKNAYIRRNSSRDVTDNMFQFYIANSIRLVVEDNLLKGSIIGNGAVFGFYNAVTADSTDIQILENRTLTSYNLVRMYTNSSNARFTKIIGNKNYQRLFAAADLIYKVVDVMYNIGEFPVNSSTGTLAPTGNVIGNESNSVSAPRRGVLASRPSLAIYLSFGQMYYATDVKMLYRWNGTAWEEVVGIATTVNQGTVLKAATQANTAATDVAGLVTDFNALLAKLKAAGIMA